MASALPVGTFYLAFRMEKGHSMWAVGSCKLLAAIELGRYM